MRKFPFYSPAKRVSDETKFRMLDRGLEPELRPDLHTVIRSVIGFPSRYSAESAESDTCWCQPGLTRPECSGYSRGEYELISPDGRVVQAFLDYSSLGGFDEDPPKVRFEVREVTWRGWDTFEVEVDRLSGRSLSGYRMSDMIRARLEMRLFGG